MSTPSRPPLTKPRKSQLVLEGTAALVSVVLLLWLLLWFVHQGSRGLQVRATYLAPSAGFVPHLEADGRGLLMAEAGAAVEPSDPTSRIGELVGNAGSPVVLSVSAPSLGEPEGFRPLELIREVAREARRDVLIVLDMAQVDSDRELGVFGNAPYRKLVDELTKDEPGPKQGANVFVLCSAAPGQVSWMIDGIGRSAFSYFVQKGLEGAARPPGGTGPVGVEDLHRFVLENTSAWARDHRRGAAQAPMLLAVGARSRPFALPTLKAPARPSPGVAVVDRSGPAASKASDSAKEGAAPLEDLMKEWARHEALQGGEAPPYRRAPGSWRVYESSVLHAERLVRASWNDPGLRERAKAALAESAARQVEVVRAIQSAGSADDRFPFRPARGDAEGERVLNASLKYVTGRILESLGGAPSDPPATPAAGVGAAVAGKVDVSPAGDPLPGPLEVAALGRPARYLELQLPAWALRFHDAYAVKTFKDDRRGGLLLDAVLNRLPAEVALARDRRGIHWIKAAIEDADDRRRSAQDELFGVGDDQDLVDRLKRQILDYGKSYEEVSAKAGRFLEGRSLFERIAARLPRLGDWEVLDGLRDVGKPEGTSDDPASSRRASVLRSAAALGDALDGPVEPGNLDEIVSRARDDFEALENAYRERARSLTGRANATGWRDIDDVLSTPFLPLELRKELIEEVVAMESKGPDLIPPPGRSTRPEGGELAPIIRIDPGFRRKALGLAGLHEGLRSLSRKGGAGPDDGSALAKLERAGDDPKEVLAAFASFTEDSRQASRRAEPASRRFGGPDASRVAVELRAADRAARLRSADGSRPAQGQAGQADQAARDLEAFSRQAAIGFHLERLVRDYARDLGPLVELAKKEFREYDVPTAPIPQGSLTPEVGPDPLPIDKEKHTASLKVVVRAQKVPEGRAFVGAFAPRPARDPGLPDAPPSKEARALDVSTGDAPGRLDLGGVAGGLRDVGADSRKPMTFLVEQVADASSDGELKPLAVRAFYRGRVDDNQSTRVAVACVKFPPAIAMAVQQDRDALARIYTREIARTMEDQFDEHPRQGFLHRNGRLDYVLTFRNNTTKEQDIMVETSLAPAAVDAPAGDVLAPMKTHGPLRLEPQKSVEVRGAVTSLNVPVDRPMAMKVSVKSKSGAALIPPERITFAQLPLDRYLTFAAERKGDTFTLRVVRKTDDPVTDPILYRNLKFSIDGQPAENFLPDDGYMGRVEKYNAVRATYAIRSNAKEIPWLVEVEGEPRSDTSKPR